METVLKMLKAEENKCRDVYETEEQYGSPEARKRAWAVYMEARKIRELAEGLTAGGTKAEENPPLTLEELRGMGQRCEGIYVAYPDGAPVFREQTYCAAVLDFSPAFGSVKMHVHAIYGDRLTLWEDDYGKTWLAYRRKPEEGAK